MSRALQRIARTPAPRQNRVPDVSARREAPATVQRLQQSAGNQTTARWLRSSPRAGGPAAVSSGLESYVAASSGGGQPLPRATQDNFGRRFGQDFSGVRVHTGSAAAGAAAEINAQAFTAGGNIHFGAGRFRPGTPAGDRLLAHELTHVVQQSGGAGASPPALRLQRQPDQPPGPPDPFPSPDADCSIDLQAGKPQDFVNCCAKTPLGRGCSKDIINGVCKVFKLNCGDKPEPEDKCPTGFKAGGSSDHKGECCQVGSPESSRSCCSADRIAVNAVSPRCCPPGTFPDAAGKNCVTLAPPLPSSLCLPGQRTLKGECCILPLVPRGDRCVLPPPPPPPPPQPRPVPSPIEVFFRKDKPSSAGVGTSAASENLTTEGNANFRKLVTVLRDNPELKVQLVGRASPEGSEQYNLALGRRRAELIAASLAGQGIGAERITDPPESELRSECETVRSGVVTCGEAGATGEGDRQVLARVF